MADTDVYSVTFGRYLEAIFYIQAEWLNVSQPMVGRPCSAIIDG